MVLRLRPVRLDDEHDAAVAQAELQRDGFSFLLGWEPALRWSVYLERLTHRRSGIEVADGWVPSTFLVAEAHGIIVGRVSIRHKLNEFLLNEGGHIGFAVRPSHRGRGYAKEILRQALIVARAEGVGDVLVTCDEGNDACRVVIESAGGVLEDARIGKDGIAKCRYWIR